MIHVRTEIAILASAIMLLLLGISPARADIYRYVDANGVVHFTNAPQYTNKPSKKSWAFYRKERRTGKVASSGGMLVHSYRDIIRQNAKAYRLDEALVKAVIKAESNYNP